MWNTDENAWVDFPVALQRSIFPRIYALFQNDASSVEVRTFNVQVVMFEWRQDD